MSSKSNILWFILALILIIASVHSATALQEDFNVYSLKKQIPACSCAITKDILTVQNTGDIASTYLIDKKGEAAKYVA